MAQAHQYFSTILRLLNLDVVVKLQLTCPEALDLRGEAKKIQPSCVYKIHSISGFGKNAMG